MGPSGKEEHDTFGCKVNIFTMGPDLEMKVGLLGLGRILVVIGDRRRVLVGSAPFVEVLEIGDVKEMRLVELKVQLTCFQEHVEIVLNRGQR